MGICADPNTVPGYGLNFSCDPNPCQNDGTCVRNSLNTSFICNCANGFGGIIIDFLKVSFKKSI